MFIQCPLLNKSVSVIPLVVAVSWTKCPHHILVFRIISNNVWSTSVEFAFVSPDTFSLVIIVLVLSLRVAELWSLLIYSTCFPTTVLQERVVGREATLSPRCQRCPDRTVYPCQLFASGAKAAHWVLVPTVWIQSTPQGAPRPSMGYCLMRSLCTVKSKVPYPLSPTPNIVVVAILMGIVASLLLSRQE